MLEKDVLDQAVQLTEKDILGLIRNTLLLIIHLLFPLKISVPSWVKRQLVVIKKNFILLMKKKKMRF
jgi:hypothetical protein